MVNQGETDWDELAKQLMASLHGIRGGRGPHSKDMEMRGEINALHALHHHPEGMTPTALARACRVSTARITKTLDQLEGRGLVERKASARDRRSVNVTLTEKGSAEVAQRIEGINNYVAGVLRELGEDDAREVVRISARLARIVVERPHEAGHPQDGCARGEDGSNEAR